MIPTCSVTAFVGLNAITISIGDDQDVALARGLVADCPSLYLWPPRRSGDNVRLRGKRTFPRTLPVRVGRHGRAPRQQDYEIYERAHDRITISHVKHKVLI